MRRVLFGSAIFLALLAAGGLIGARLIQNWLQAPISGLIKPTVYEVPRGTSTIGLALDLHKRGLIRYPRIFAGWARLSERAGAIKAGEYELLPGMSPSGLLDLFTIGKVILHSITFVEGATFADIRHLMAANPALTPTLAQKTTEEIMQRLRLDGVHPEGQFFPDTYHFAKGTSDVEVLMVANRRLRAELAAAWSQRADDLLLSSAYEALILASIVEKETALASERRKIAGVFAERLKRGMRLETDPTVIYGLSESYDGNIRKADLRRDTPYNTYTRTGLPPTPICLPGAESIKAAVNPEITGDLFFVATGAMDGSHHFSKNLQQHNAAVRKYLQVLRARKTAG